MAGEKKPMTDQEIGLRLKNLRDGRTAIITAERLGISPSTYRSYEYGQRHVPDNMKIRIAAYYGKSVEEIFYAQ